MNLENLRKEFPFLQQKFSGKPVIYFDNAATTLKPRLVIDEIVRAYEKLSVNIHRAFYKIAEEAAMLYDESHAKTAEFIGAESRKEIIFTKNTTEAINLAARSLFDSKMIKKGDEIVTTIMEHHSNLLPYLRLKEYGVKVNIAEIKNDYSLDLNDFQEKLSKHTKLAAFAMASNTIGTINPVEKMVKIVREASPEALILLDGAQGVPHYPVDMKKLGADFMAFSSHKMLGPTGLGVLYGKEELLNKMQPFLTGGGMISKVSLNRIEYAPVPEKFEAGTPPIAQAIAFIKSMEFLEKIGMKKIREQEIILSREMLKQMKNVSSVQLYCPQNAEKQTSTFLFRLGNIHPHDISSLADEMNNICLRAGMHCAEPLLRRISDEGMARASLYLYNTKDEIKVFAETLQEMEKMFEK